MLQRKKYFDIARQTILYTFTAAASLTQRTELRLKHHTVVFGPLATRSTQRLTCVRVPEECIWMHVNELACNRTVAARAYLLDCVRVTTFGEDFYQLGDHVC